MTSKALLCIVLDDLQEKIRSIAREIYRAEDVDFSEEATSQLEYFQKNGYGELPVCMAKTQYSFSGDPLLKGTRHKI